MFALLLVPLRPLPFPTLPPQDGHRTALHWACQFDRVAIVEYLVGRGADVDAVDKDGNTPMHYLAGWSSSPALVLQFLRLDAAHTELNNMGETPADLARRYGKDLHARIIDNWDPKVEELVMPDDDPDDVVGVDTSAARYQAKTHAAGPDREKHTIAATVMSGNVASTAVRASEGENDLTKVVRTLAIKRQRQGDMHRSLVPTLARAARLFEDAGDFASARDCLEHRLKIVEAEAASEEADLRGLVPDAGAGAGAGAGGAGTGSPSRGAAVHGKWSKELAFALVDLGRLVLDLKDVRLRWRECRGAVAGGTPVAEPWRVFTTPIARRWPKRKRCCPGL